LVHRQRPPAQLRPVQGVDRLAGLGRVRHLDEAEAAGTPGLAVGDEGDLAHAAVRAEEVLQLLLRRLEREIAYVDLHDASDAFPGRMTERGPLGVACARLGSTLAEKT